MSTACAALLRPACSRRPGAIDPFAPSRRRPTAWRCCSSASTSSSCATTTSAAARWRWSRSFVRRIDRLQERAGRTPPATRRGRRTLPDDEQPGRREREFAAVFRAHDRMLAERARARRGRPARASVLRRRTSATPRAERWPAAARRRLAGARPRRARGWSAGSSGPAALTAAGDDDQAVERRRAGGAGELLRFVEQRPGATVVAVAQLPLPPARARRGARGRRADRGSHRQGPRGGRAARSAFWRAANERSAGAERRRRARAADLARGRRARADRRARARRSREEGQAVAVALEERAVPYRVVGAAAFFERAEVRDVLAWLRLLADPRDAAAVVRALARPPIELRSVDIARCVQIARRRKLDMVAALAAATESPQVPPEARERILGVPRAAALGGRGARHDARRPLRAPADRAPRAAPPPAVRARRPTSSSGCVNLARLGELAAAYARSVAAGDAREFAR